MKNIIVNKKTADVTIDYQENFLDTADLKEIKEILSEKNLSLETHTHPPKIIGGIEELFPVISVLFTPESVNFMSSVVGNLFYDIAKNICKYIYNSLKKKTYYTRITTRCAYYYWKATFYPTKCIR